MDYYSACAMHLQMRFNETQLAHGTGFLFLWRERPYLVTALHNVTGRHWAKDSPLHSRGGLPDRIRASFWFMIEKDEGNFIGGGHYTFLVECEGKQTFLRANSSPKSDVAVFDLRQLAGRPELFEDEADYSQFSELFGEGHDFRSVFKLSFVDGLVRIPIVNDKIGGYRPAVGQDLFIIGYPLNFAKAGDLPIWKRGSIATEPEYNYDDKPAFLIDAITREGLSGAPVVGDFVNPTFDNDGKGTLMKIGTDRAFAGIYTARLGASDDFSAQMGLVWTEAAILDVIRAGEVDH